MRFRFLVLAIVLAISTMAGKPPPPPKPVLPTVSVIAPNGGEAWKGHETHGIMWSFTPGTMFVSSVTIELSKDGGTTWLPLKDNLPPSASPWLWKIPNTFNSTRCLVKVSLYYTGTGMPASYVSDVSDGYFTVEYVPEVNYYVELQ